MKAVCAKGINSAANHHLLGLTLWLPTHLQLRWNTMGDEPSFSHLLSQKPFCQLCKNVSACVCDCVCLYRGACIVDIFPPPLISTRESWGQSEPRLMRVGENRSDKVGVRQLQHTMLNWCYSIIHPSYHAVTLKGHHLHGTNNDVWACDISHVCVCVCEWKELCETSHRCTLMILLPIFVSHYLSLHISVSL